MARRILTTLTVMVLCFGLVPLTVQAASLTLVPVKDTVFELRGQGLAKVGGIDVTLEYDSGALSNPRVSAGHLVSGAMLLANPKHPGQLRFAIVQANRKGISGRGVVATITFDRVGTSPPREMDLKATVADVAGVKVKVTTSIRNPKKVPGLHGGLPSESETPPVETDSAE